MFQTREYLRKVHKTMPDQWPVQFLAWLRKIHPQSVRRSEIYDRADLRRIATNWLHWHRFWQSIKLGHS